MQIMGEPLAQAEVTKEGDKQKSAKMDEIKNSIDKNLVPEVICSECSLPIKGLIVRAMNQAWHPEHFCCFHCKKPISGNKFNVEDNKPYCVDDYSQLFLKRCQGCNLPIRDVVVVALNSFWHFDHFVCVTCGTRLSNNGFYEKETNAFCQACYQDKFCPKCKECDKPIFTTAIMALGERWHVGCFKCTKCNKPISEPTFELSNGKQLCERCVKPDDFLLESEYGGAKPNTQRIVDQ